MDHPIILFDGVCNLCTGWVRFVLKHDRAARFRFAPLQSTAARDQLRRHGVSVDTVDGVVVIEPHRVYRDSTAALRVMHLLGGPWALCAVLGAVPRPLRDWVYRAIARNRYRWFGRQDACAPPPQEWRSRFLDAGER